VTAFFHFKASKLDNHVQLLEVRELLECYDLFFILCCALLARERVVWLVSQHDLEEDLGSVVHESDFIGNDIEHDELLEVDCRQACHWLQRVEPKLRLFMQPQEHQERQWRPIRQLQQQLPHVGL